MKNELNLGYYYGIEAEQFAFFRIPKLLFTDSRFSCLSAEAKLLYGMMLDRMSLSLKNQWLDEENRVYIIFTVKEIMDMMMCSEQKVTKVMKELDSKFGIGLIERKRRGLGKADIIYVKNFVLPVNKYETEYASDDKDDEFDNIDYEETENVISDNFDDEKTSNNQEPPKSHFKNHEIGGSRTSKNEDQEPPNSGANNTDINNTEFNDTYPIQSCHERKISLSTSADEKESKRLVYKQLICTNISYDALIKQNRQDRIDEIVNIMLDAVCSDKESLIVGGEALPQRMVRDRLLKLNSSHIEYVNECMDNCTSRIKNIRKYLLAALYNSLSTIDHYYIAKVNHDFREE